MKAIRDSFRECLEKNNWADVKIRLLDTVFWATLSKRPEDFTEKYRNKAKLLEVDFAVMPMFES
jgi:hypothetical protein